MTDRVKETLNWLATEPLHRTDDIFKAVAQAETAIRQAISEELEGMKKVEGEHTKHVFDESYCYNCQDTVDEEAPDPYGTNWKYNLAITDAQRTILKGREK